MPQINAADIAITLCAVVFFVPIAFIPGLSARLFPPVRSDDSRRDGHFVR